MKNLVYSKPNGANDGTNVDDNSSHLTVVNEEEPKEIKEDTASITVWARVGKNFRSGNVSDHSQEIVSRSLDTSGRDPVLWIVFCVVNVSILHVGNIQSGNVSIIAKYSVVSIRRNDSALKKFLTNDGGERVGGNLGVNVDQPRMTWSRLEQKLSTSTATRFQVDESSDILDTEMIKMS